MELNGPETNVDHILFFFSYILILVFCCFSCVVTCLSVYFLIVASCSEFPHLSQPCATLCLLCHWEHWERISQPGCQCSSEKVPKTMRYTEDNLFSFLWPLASYRAKVKLLSTKLRYNIQYFLSGTLRKKDFQLLIFISFFYYHLAADQAAIF